jgi:hypothetical protein
MPVARRIPIDRQFRPFSPEVIDLFLALERVKPSRRYQDPRSKQLAKLLGLISEFWTVNHVNDVSPPPGRAAAREPWIRCREVRTQLLEAVHGDHRAAYN